MTWIRIRVQFQACKADGSPASEDEAYAVAAQVREDALFGTFAELDEEFWGVRMDTPPKELSRLQFDGALDAGVFQFTLELSSRLFAPNMGGYTHLFSMLAGDLLRFVLPPLRVSQFKVTDLSLPADWQKAHEDQYRERSHSISSVRNLLQIEEGMPLLALSFKPRVGFRLDALAEVAAEVLDAGFHLIELDTRFLPVDKRQLEDLKNLAIKLADRNGGMGRLSLNFSLPTDVLLENLADLLDRSPDPVVIKVDGSLGGIDAIQAVRRSGIVDAAKNSPIITCYPLMKSALQDFVPPQEVVRALSLSGADIMYPGNRPDIGNMWRSLDGNEASSFVAAAERYRSIVASGYPMPTIAGGIYAGQLHSYYELLGPQVGWFLGGGVALHRDGPGAGAELCVEIAKRAAEAHVRGRGWAGALGGRIAERCDEAYSGRASLDQGDLRYYAPDEVFNKYGRLKPFDQD
jgi:ribulose 1,5-bisphosphate carboxylase large subunit-like protein